MKKILISVFWISNIFIAFSQEPPTSKKIDIDAYIDEYLLEEESLDEMLASFTNFSFLYASVNL